MITGQFTLPIQIDLAATFLFGLTGGLAALKRGYDVVGLVREEPLLFKPGQFYVLAALAGCLLFALLALQFEMEATRAALIAIGATFVFRVLAIQFNWRSSSLWQAPPAPPSVHMNPANLSLGRQQH